MNGSPRFCTKKLKLSWWSHGWGNIPEHLSAPNGWGAEAFASVLAPMAGPWQHWLGQIWDDVSLQIQYCNDPFYRWIMLNHLHFKKNVCISANETRGRNCWQFLVDVRPHHFSSHNKACPFGPFQNRNFSIHKTLWWKHMLGLWPSARRGPLAAQQTKFAFLKSKTFLFICI